MAALKGKQLTLGAKIVAAVIVVASLVLKATGKTPSLAIDDAIKVAAFVAIIFAPVDISLWLEKFFPGVQSGSVSSTSEQLNEGEAPHG